MTDTRDVSHWVERVDRTLRERGYGASGIVYDLLPLLSAELSAARREGREEGREAAIEAALNAVPCVCHEAYWKRNLEDPGCQHHDLAAELGVPERSPHKAELASRGQQ